MRIQLMVHEDSVDTLAKMLVGYVLHMPDTETNYTEKVTCVVEFLEEAMDASFGSVAVYLTVLNLLPPEMTRRMPYRIESFLKMYERQVEQALGGPIPEKYKPKHIEEVKKTIIDVDGNPIITVTEKKPEIIV